MNKIVKYTIYNFLLFEMVEIYPFHRAIKFYSL